MGNGTDAKAGYDEGALRDLNGRVNNLGLDLQQLKNEFAKWMKDI
jgi:hypothetical protein